MPFIQPHAHVFEIFLLKILICIINTAPSKYSNRRRPILTLCDPIVAQVITTTETNECELSIDSNQFEDIIALAKQSSTVRSANEREIYVVPVSLSFGGISHAQLWLVSYDKTQEKKRNIQVLDPNGKSYRLCDEFDEDDSKKKDTRDEKKVHILNKKLRIKDHITNLQLDDVKPTYSSKTVLPCTHTHYKCWLVVQALLAKKFLNSDLYSTTLGFPNAIHSKKDLKKIITAITSKGQCLTGREVRVVGPSNPKKITLQYGFKENTTTHPKKGQGKVHKNVRNDTTKKPRRSNRILIIKRKREEGH